MRSYLLPRRFCEKPLNYAAEADPTRAFDGHDISGSQEAEQCIDSVIGGWPQSTPIRLRQSVVECCDRVPHQESPVDPRSGKRHGDMLELGEATDRLHRELAVPLARAGVDRAFLVGNAVAALYDALPKPNRGGLWPTADDAIDALLRFLRAGDVVTVKGSRGIGLGSIVERLLAESARQEI